MRAWRNRSGVAQRDGGRHLDGPELRVSPENLILRHYLNLSLEIVSLLRLRTRTVDRSPIAVHFILQGR